MTGYAYSRARLKAILDQRREIEAEQFGDECDCPHCKEDLKTRERISAISIDDVSSWIEGKTKKPKTQQQREQRKRRQKTAKLNQEVAGFEKALTTDGPKLKLKLPSHTRDLIAKAFC
jgi:hypothetical protein